MNTQNEEEKLCKVCLTIIQPFQPLVQCSECGKIVHKKCQKDYFCKVCTNTPLQEKRRLRNIVSNSHNSAIILLTTNAVKDMLHVSERTLLYWRARKYGPKHIDIGIEHAKPIIRYHRDDVQDFINARRK
jgi:hypothetical protein